MENKNQETKTKSFKRYIAWFWSVFALGILALILLFVLAGWGGLGPMPTFEELENPETNLATEIFSADGETLGKYYSENRTPIKYEDLPDHLVQALVATEDERFYEHSGIDAQGTLRAVVFFGTRGGASTITQQLAKQLFTDDIASNAFERILYQKSKEWVIATRLERQYTKEEIITMYLNKYGFGYQGIGIRSASNIYFGKEAKDLKIEESAVLVGMLKNSSLYNPVRRPEIVRKRRNQVFKQMMKNGYLSQEEKDSLRALPMDIKFTPQGHDEGIATYFRVYLQGFMRDWIKENPKSDGSEYNIYRDGLKIYTSIDSRMQKYAEEAVVMHMANLQKEFDQQNKLNKTAPFRDISVGQVESIINKSMKVSDRWKKMEARGKSKDEIIASFTKETPMRVFSWQGIKDTVMTPRDSIFYYKSFLNTGMMSMTPQTGEVKAWVGGIDFKHFKYEHVKQGKRQVGSTFKPFVYATAIDQLKVSPCDNLPRGRYTIEAGRMGAQRDWSPRNNDGNYDGMMTLKAALAQSVNSITARLIDKTGPGPVIEMIKKMGVDTKDIPGGPSIALGTADISVFEMVSAYSTFVNEGVHVKPVLVARIEDKNGTILYLDTPASRDVMSKETAYVTINLLEGVTQGGSSGARLRGDWAVNQESYKRAMTGYPYNLTNPIAGKTGTTQNNSDGWFMGMVPNLVTGVWVGGEDRAVHFPGITYGQGATMALPIWGIYMNKVYANKELEISSGAFPKPDNLSIEINCDLYNNSDTKNQGFPDELEF